MSEEDLHVRVPASPAWSVRDVLAHVVGLAADLNAQRFPDAADSGGTAWTRRQVEHRRSWKLGDVVAEWDREAPTFEAGLNAFGYEMGSHFVADLHAHHQDVRSAVGLPPDADEVTVAVALDHYAAALDHLLIGAEWGTVDVVSGHELRRLGAVSGPHHARVQAEPFELLRALSARRSLRQLRALDWEGDVDDLLAFLQTEVTGGYALPAADLLE
ncbi:MAG: hypothetical protein AB7Q42_14205 [Acidimicrobiia bacterium]